MSVKQVEEWAKEVGAVSDVLLHGRHDNVVFTSGELLRFVELVAAKAGEVMRERCESTLDTIGAEDNCYGGAHAIRALPGITLEDLK